MAMASGFQNTLALLRTVVLGGLVLVAGWWTLFLRGKLVDNEAEIQKRDAEIELLAERVSERDGQIEELDQTLQEREAFIVDLEEDIVEKEAQIKALDVALNLLKIDHRLARIEVLDQGPAPDDPDSIETRLRFVELDADGEPMGAGREMTVRGKTVYVETLVVKFGDQYVEQGDALRGTSICLFKRVFGEEQKPSEGQPIDAAGLQPLAYTDDEGPSPLHRELWDRFWDYANDPELAEQLGVRAIHGEAPFIETRSGKTYRLELRASGGLTIQAE